MHLLPKTSRLLIACTLLLLLQLPGRAQTPTLGIKGTVTTDKGAPVEGASVIIPGTNKGAITDGKGSFHLAAPVGSLLLITYVGYDTARVTAQPVVNVTLHPGSAALNDVIVIGYGTAKRKDLTGSLAVVSEKDFQGGAITTPEQLIAGKVAGVSITSNGGSPGSGSVIRIRGVVSLPATTHSLSSTASPLAATASPAPPTP
jgi:hypothetical protein